MTNEADCWFPAKRHGWGWGLPRRWQGWVALAAFSAVLVAAQRFFPPAADPLRFALLAGADALGLIWLCLVKGERPRWRWGDRDAP